MSEEIPDKQSSASGWVIGVIMALLIYILSPGPVFLLLDKGVIKPESMVFRVLLIGLRPIEKLSENAEPVKKFYLAYFKAIGINTAK